MTSRGSTLPFTTALSFLDQLPAPSNVATPTMAIGPNPIMVPLSSKPHVPFKVRRLHPCSSLSASAPGARAHVNTTTTAITNIVRLIRSYIRNLLRLDDGPCSEIVPASGHAKFNSRRRTNDEQTRGRGAQLCSQLPNLSR